MKEYKVTTTAGDIYIIKATYQTIKDLLSKGIIIDCVEVK